MFGSCRFSRFHCPFSCDGVFCGFLSFGSQDDARIDRFEECPNVIGERSVVMRKKVKRDRDDNFSFLYGGMPGDSFEEFL